jgi:RHS repeat-associated protein
LEESLGLDLYEMDVRSYDPTIGRFNGIDPVTHFTQGTSVAFDNNPVYWADPSGADSTADWMERNKLTDKDLDNVYDSDDGGWTQTDPKEVVKKSIDQFKKAKKLGGKFKKAYTALNGLYSLGNGASHDDQINALKDVYNSLGGLLKGNPSFKVFAMYYDTYLAMVNYQMSIIVKGLKEKSHAMNRIALQGQNGDGYFYATGAFPGGRHMYSYMQQIKKAIDGGNHKTLVNISSKVLSFVHEYQNILQFATGQSLPSMYTSNNKIQFKILNVISPEGSALDYQTAEYFLPNFRAIEKTLYGGIKVQN